MLQQVEHSEALGHLHTVSGIWDHVLQLNEQGEPVSADHGWDPAFPPPWGEAVQQLTEQELPACEPSTLRLSWTMGQPRVAVSQGRHASPG